MGQLVWREGPPDLDSAIQGGGFGCADGYGRWIPLFVPHNRFGHTIHVPPLRHCELYVPLKLKWEMSARPKFCNWKSGRHVRFTAALSLDERKYFGRLSVADGFRILTARRTGHI
jgi:hypothetical protein